MTTGSRSYRQRLYEHYLAGQGKGDIGCLRADIEHRAPYVRKVIRTWVPQDPATRILDIGCGYGAFLYFLRQAGYRNLTGFDASPEQVEAARELGLECVQRGDALDVLRKCEDASIDVVIAFDVLEHLPREDLLVFTEAACRVLRPGGRLIVHVPNGEGIFWGAVYCGDLTHQTAFTRRSIQQLMRTCGFDGLVVEEDVPIVHSMRSVARYVVWQAYRAFFRLLYAAETGDAGRHLVLSQNLLAVASRASRNSRHKDDGRAMIPAPTYGE